MTTSLAKTIIGLAFYCFFLISTNNLANASDSVNGAPVQLKNTHVYNILSPKSNTPIKVYVITPEAYNPQDIHPVLYAFDADLHLGLMSSLTQQASRVINKLGLKAPIVVAIGYGDTNIALERRITDLTPNADHFDIHKRPNAKPWPKLGGGDLFLRLLSEDIKPFIESHYKIDTTMETLYGHSLGGLLTLHALTSITDQFDRYVAASPSLWFNKSKTMQDVIAFNIQQKTSDQQKIPLLLTIGGDEEVLKGFSLRHSTNPELRATWLKKNRMLTNAMELQETLRKQNGKIDVTFQVYGGLEHMPANPAAFYDALNFASEKIRLQQHP